MPIITIATSKNKCKYATPSETIFVNHNTRKSYVQISAVNDPNTPHPTTCMCISSQICLFWISKCVILCNGGWGVWLLRNYAKYMLPAGWQDLFAFGENVNIWYSDFFYPPPFDKEWNSYYFKWPSCGKGGSLSISLWSIDFCNFH